MRFNAQFIARMLACSGLIACQDSATAPLPTPASPSTSGNFVGTSWGNRPPKANPDAAAATGGETISIPALLNDSDPEGQRIQLVAVGQPTKGSALKDGNLVRYSAPLGFEGTVTFTYAISDGILGASASIAVTIGPRASEPPATRADSAVTFLGVPVMLDVTANDVSPVGAPILIRNLANVSGGTARIVNNTVELTPTSSRIASFTYEAYSIGYTGTATGTATVRVANSAPNARSDSYVVSGSMVLGVTANDSDVDLDAITIVAVAQGYMRCGTATLAGGSITYAALLLPAVCSEVFTYTLRDSRGAEATTTVTVVVPAQIFLVAVDDAFRVPQLGGHVLPVLDNDRSAPGRMLTVTGVSSNGGHVFLIDGQVQLVPGSSTSTILVTYTVTDGVHSATATAKVFVY